jgi:ATP-dependent DNA ligase
MSDQELKRLAGVLAPLQAPKMALAPPPRDSRFGSPLNSQKVHWVRPEVVVEVTYLTWTEGGLLGAVSYQGQREDKPARQVVRPIPHPLLPNNAVATEKTFPALRFCSSSRSPPTVARAGFPGGAS